MVENFITKQQGLEFRQLVLEHIKKILEISTKELKKDRKEIVHTNYSQIIDSEDTRKCYVQAIENLAYILIPYFDDEMQETFDKLIKIIDIYPREYWRSYKKEIEQEHNFYKNEHHSEKGIDYDYLKFFLIQKQVKYAKKLFVALNQLLRRNDYLKAGIYSEGDLDDDEEPVDIDQQ